MVYLITKESPPQKNHNKVTFLCCPCQLDSPSRQLSRTENHIMKSVKRYITLFTLFNSFYSKAKLCSTEIGFFPFCLGQITTIILHPHLGTVF